MKKLFSLTLFVVGFSIGCTFTILWSVGTLEGKAYMEKHRNDPIIRWFPNLPG